MREERLGRPGRSLWIASSVPARTGRGPQALRSLDTAAQLLKDGPTDRDPRLGPVVRPAGARRSPRTGAGRAGEPDRAAALLHGAAHAGDDGPAYRVLFAAEPARVLAGAGDRREAETAMATLMGAVPAVGSGRALRAMGHAARLVEHGHRVPRRTRDTARHLASLLPGRRRVPA
ncbi:hypothetical protein ACFCZ1_02690 [Streptomyces sp. NPDC056224]|uniref:hypothetical protein n=1 Tax=Streptomyces sp. NPDC056224 TaxID=3345750 RepID=UPI0035E1501C